jgi:hypothetical protein
VKVLPLEVILQVQVVVILEVVDQEVLEAEADDNQ